jgi:hypothetical protein
MVNIIFSEIRLAVNYNLSEQYIGYRRGHLFQLSALNIQLICLNTLIRQ